MVVWPPFNTAAIVALGPMEPVNVVGVVAPVWPGSWVLEKGMLLVAIVDDFFQLVLVDGLAARNAVAYH